MKRLAALALVLAGVVSPVCAQRGGSRGGFASAPSFRGATATSHFSYSGARPLTPNRSGIRPSSISPSYRIGSSAYRARPSGYASRDRYRRPYVPAYGIGLPYGYLGLGYPDYGFSGDYGDVAYSAPPPPSYPDYAPQGYDQGPPAPIQQAYAAPAPQSPPASEEAVTLIFKDGRAPEQIHNYVLTPTTLYVRDQRKREISVDLLDLDATRQTNREAGIDFQLPAGPIAAR